MKSKYIKYTILAVAVVSVLAFTVFKHEHTFAEATCTTPKTCTECNEIEGEPLGHSWLEATCTASKTCEICNLTEGNPLEHTWLEATTEAPETCDSCGLTQGEPLAINDEKVHAPQAKEELKASDYNLPISDEDLQKLAELIMQDVYGNSGGGGQVHQATPEQLEALGATPAIVDPNDNVHFGQTEGSDALKGGRLE